MTLQAVSAFSMHMQPLQRATAFLSNARNAVGWKWQGSGICRDSRKKTATHSDASPRFTLELSSSRGSPFVFVQWFLCKPCLEISQGSKIYNSLIKSKVLSQALLSLSMCLCSQSLNFFFFFCFYLSPARFYHWNKGAQGANTISHVWSVM